jgi:demethylmenaquinone methyltransferase/2-methoxy-6-polyprenyl-1,4-benzoquinol methylase
LLRAYLKHVVPPASLAVTGSVRALRLMRYYWESIDTCVSPEAIIGAMGRAGLEGAVRHRTLGVFSEYVATAPAQPSMMPDGCDMLCSRGHG